ncbi:MAG: hypothetical protein AAGA60_24785 [Cyanobacteria bacterium P01_E01_bin.42]
MTSEKKREVWRSRKVGKNRAIALWTILKHKQIGILNFSLFVKLIE